MIGINYHLHCYIIHDIGVHDMHDFSRSNIHLKFIHGSIKIQQ